MKRENISEVIENIDSKYVEEATEYKGKKASYRMTWYKWGVAAACLVLLVLGGIKIILPGLLTSQFKYKHQIMGAESYAKNMERGLIEVAPLAYMRGRTLDNAFIILDEAQNSTPAQMKMFLTRIGFGSKVIITGDSSQKDLPAGTQSGLDVAIRVLKDIDDISFCRLTSKDVVRHPLVQKIVCAYEDYEKKEAYREKTKQNAKNKRNTK